MGVRRSATAVIPVFRYGQRPVSSCTVLAQSKTLMLNVVSLSLSTELRLSDA